MRTFICLTAAAAMLLLVSPKVDAGEVEYYRDNLFLGLAYHRIACHSYNNVLDSNMEWDGFTTKNYCSAGMSLSGPESNGAKHWQSKGDPGISKLYSCGSYANDRFGTYNYSSSSSTCTYSIWCDCNSDCWIKKFSSCAGSRVSIESPCCSSWWCGC